MITHITINPNAKGIETERVRHWKPFNHSVRIFSSIVTAVQIAPVSRARMADAGESYQCCTISILPEGGMISLSGRLEGTPLKEALKFNIGDVGPHTTHCWLKTTKPMRTTKVNNQLVQFLITSDYHQRDRLMSMVVGPLATQYMLDNFPTIHDMPGAKSILDTPEIPL